MKKLLFLSFLAVFTVTLTAQVAINTDGTAPDASAMLDVKSTDKGFLLPRMTYTQMNAIISPEQGLMVYNTTLKSICFFDGTIWKNIYDNDGETGTITYGGQTYQTVIIGTQCWMSENLNIGTRIDGSVNQTQNSPTEIIEKYCYGDNTSNCDTYGGLYQWDEIMQYITTEGTQGICPTGWHLPTDAEWQTMEMYLGMTQAQAEVSLAWRGTDEGGKLKEIGTSHWLSPNAGATNSSGFTGLPAGYRALDGLFGDLTHLGYFWSSSKNVTASWYRVLSYDNAQVYRNHGYLTYGFSVRCVQD